jgi:hypothetical protein
MKLSLFYETPVAQLWAADSERRAFTNTLELAAAARFAGSPAP